MNYDMQQTAKAAGLTASVIRVWEQRYGWPRPRRLPNGYRQFSQHEVEQLKKVADLVKSGVSVGELLVDGSPQFPVDPTAPRPQRPVVLAHAVPMPASREGRTARLRVDDAVEALDTATLREEVVAALRLRPSDRMPAVYVPVIAFLCESALRDTLVFGRDALTRTIVEAVGADVLTSVGEQLREKLTPAAAVSAS